MAMLGIIIAIVFLTIFFKAYVPIRMALLGIPHVWTNRDKPIGVQFRFKKTCLRNVQSFGTRIGFKPIEHTPK